MVQLVEERVPRGQVCALLSWWPVFCSFSWASCCTTCPVSPNVSPSSPVDEGGQEGGGGGSEFCRISSTTRCHLRPLWTTVWLCHLLRVGVWSKVRSRKTNDDEMMKTNWRITDGLRKNLYMCRRWERKGKTTKKKTFTFLGWNGNQVLDSLVVLLCGELWARNCSDNHSQYSNCQFSLWFVEVSLLK